MKLNNSNMLSRAVSNAHIRSLLTSAIEVLARIVQYSVYDKITLEPAGLFEQLTPGEPVIFAVSHTGRFVDVTSVLFHLLSRNWNGIQIVAWDGFVTDPDQRKLLRILPLDNQLSRHGKTREKVRELLAKVRHQILDIQSTLSAGKWIIIFPSEICGAGRHENPWKTGASDLVYNEVTTSGSSMKVVLLGINYENYTQPALSQILIRGEIITITPDLDAKAIHRLMVEHEKRLMVWHLDYFPTYEEALPFLTDTAENGDDERKWTRLLRYSPAEMVTALKQAIARSEVDEATARMQFATIVEAAKTRMTELEDVLISLLGRKRSVYERTVAADSMLEQQLETTTFNTLLAATTLDTLLLEYRRLCNKAGIPFGRDDAYPDFRVLTAGLFLLLPGMFVHGIGRICRALLPASTVASFYKRENEVQFRAQNLFFRSTAAWSSLHLILGATGALVAIMVIHLALAEELLIGLGVLTATATVTSAVFTFKYGWMFKLVWLRSSGSRTLRQIRKIRAAIRAAMVE